MLDRNVEVRNKKTEQKRMEKGGREGGTERTWKESVS